VLYWLSCTVKDSSGDWKPECKEAVEIFGAKYPPSYPDVA